MNRRIELLDHGYIELVETWGSDERIIEAARMSTGKGFTVWGPVSCDACMGDGEVARTPNTIRKCEKCKGSGSVPGDEKLLRYLYENKHFTPFEMGGLIIEVKAPIFVFREWHRHRTQSYNELSARYTPMPNQNYIPSIERMLFNAGGTNKQAGTVKGSETLNRASAMMYQGTLAAMYDAQEELYQRALKAGVPKELARIHLPVGRYSCMRASANLRNWLAFLTLRMDAGAQWEIRQYAHALSEIIQDTFPRTHQLFSENRR